MQYGHVQICNMVKTLIPVSIALQISSTLLPVDILTCSILAEDEKMHKCNDRITYVSANDTQHVSENYDFLDLDLCQKIDVQKR